CLRPSRRPGRRAVAGAVGRPRPRCPCRRAHPGHAPRRPGRARGRVRGRRRPRPPRGAVGAARAGGEAGADGGSRLRRRPPPAERLVTLVDGYLLAPLFLIVPLMVASVLAADAFAGEKERKTLESLLHLPIPEGDLFYAKVLGAFVPAVLISWIGFVAFAIVV